MTSTATLRVCTGMPRRSAPLTGVTAALAEGDSVVADDGTRIRLGKRVGGGGEGSVFEASAGLVCKVYDPNRITTATQDKLALMLRNRVVSPGICWPKSLARDASGRCVGYLMDRARGKELQRTIFVKPLLQSTFPSWTRLEIAQLTIAILERIQLLHARNILIGDVNPMNILVADSRSVFFVDTDSYQLEDFPCPVGLATFLTPDLLGKNLATVLREWHHEHFAVATLVFMILMPGKAPYSHAGGGAPADNVRERHFPYGVGDKKSDGAPDGPWRFIWSHFPRYLKDAFTGAFVDDQRWTAAEWLMLVERYRHDLTRGNTSREIFPVGFKELRRAEIAALGGQWLACEACGSGFGRCNRTDSLCLRCRNTKVEHCCVLCTQPFTAHLRSARRQHEPICSGCHALTLTRQCRSCSNAFELRAPERAFFKRKGFDEPKRCPACRKARASMAL